MKLDKFTGAIDDVTGGKTGKMGHFKMMTSCLKNCKRTTIHCQSKYGTILSKVKMVAESEKMGFDV